MRFQVPHQGRAIDSGHRRKLHEQPQHIGQARRDRRLVKFLHVRASNECLARADDDEAVDPAGLEQGPGFDAGVAQPFAHGAIDHIDRPVLDRRDQGRTPDLPVHAIYLQPDSPVIGSALRRP